MKTLAGIRQSGLACDLDEHTSGISAIGFAFRDWSGDLHSISVPVPSTRFKKIRSKVEATLRLTAKHVEGMMEHGTGIDLGSR